MSKKPDRPTPRVNRIAHAAAEVLLTDDPDELGFLHSVLAQCNLPYRDPKGQRDYVRESGRASIVVSGGHLIDPQSRKPVLQGLPYGAKPRLILLHLCTEAVRTKSPVVEIEDSMTAFMRALGFSTTGGKNGSIRPFKEQLNRLAASRIQLMYRGDNRASIINPPSVIERLDVWFPEDHRQTVMWASSVRLSEQFFESVRKHALPLDLRTVRALKHSARALDLYTWLAHRLPRVKSRDGDFISWKALQGQFGPDTSRRTTFLNSMLPALQQTLASYQKARVTIEQGGLLLKESPPPIAKKLFTHSLVHKT